MRFEVVKAIYQAGLEDKRVCFVSGDYGHANTEEFKRDFPGRYFNAGMSEQNIIGIAAGLALSGMKVFVYSIVPFITLRCLEQIKIDVCHHNVDVTIIGGGGGFAYANAGVTHYAIEDVAALRALPNMKIISPSNPTEARLLMQALIKVGGPAYVRIGRGKEPDFELEYAPEIGKAGIVRSGDDITLIASGAIITEAIRVRDMLAEQGISVEVANMHTIKPLDGDFIRARAGIRKAIFTLEEHNILGGLGGAVAEELAELPQRPLFKRFGVPDMWPDVVGSQQYLRDAVGIEARDVAEKIRDFLR